MKNKHWRDDPQLEDLSYAQLLAEYSWRTGSKRTFKNRSEAINAIRVSGA